MKFCTSIIAAVLVAPQFTAAANLLTGGTASMSAQFDSTTLADHGTDGDYSTIAKAASGPDGLIWWNY